MKWIPVKANKKSVASDDNTCMEIKVLNLSRHFRIACLYFKGFPGGRLNYQPEQTWTWWNCDKHKWRNCCCLYRHRHCVLASHLASFRGQEKKKIKSSFTKADDHSRDNSWKEKSVQNSMSVTAITKECKYLWKRVNSSTILTTLCIKTWNGVAPKTGKRIKLMG